MSIESAVPDAGRCDSDNAMCMVGSKTAAIPIAIMTTVLDFKARIYVQVSPWMLSYPYLPHTLQS